MQVLFVAVVACCLCVSVSHAFQTRIPANQNWECDDCGDNKSIIFGVVRHALYSESREVYLNFDHTWMDKVLNTRENVVVKNVKRESLANYKAHDTISSPDSDRDETYHIVVSLHPESSQNEPLSEYDADILDNFLTLNPCWIPIHEPPIYLRSNSSSVTGSSLSQQLFFEYSVVFIRLPSFPFHSTCQLYTMISKIQNPSECPSKDSEQVQANYLGNIGWANCLHPLTEHFIDAMHNSRVFITPRAWDNGAAKELQATVDGQEVAVSGPWQAWADPNECRKDVYAWNPWHCHFMSLSKCNTPALHDNKFEEHRVPDPPGGSEYLRELEKIKDMREKYNDGPHLGNEWEYSRLLAWVQRPNAQLRYRIRKNLHLSLVNLRRGYQSDLSGTELEARAHAGHHLLRAEPCLGMHVRHGDAQNDERGRSKLDRSFEAHVSCAKTLAEPMGLTNIYIATDDNKVFTTAHTQFPEFSWFAQQRALKDFTGSSFEGYHSEKSAQAEVANIMTDLIFMSRCSALVGTFDSGIMNLYLQTACTRSKSGKCPPSQNLWRCQPETIVEGVRTGD